MKKVLLFACAAVMAGSISAQNCMNDINTTDTTLGFVPNPIVGATETVPYDEVVTIVLPASVDNPLQPGTQLPLCAISIEEVTGVPAGYSFEVWAKIRGVGADYDVMATSLDTIGINPNTSVTRACLRLKNPNPGAPDVTPIDSVPITVVVGAFIETIGCQGPLGTDTFIVKLPIKSSVYVGIEEEAANSKEFAVFTNFPNPASTSTTLTFATPTAEQVKISLQDALGRTVRTFNMTSAQGLNMYNINTSDLQSGMYSYTISYNNKSITKKMIVNN